MPDKKISSAKYRSMPGPRSSTKSTPKVVSKRAQIRVAKAGDRFVFNSNREITSNNLLIARTLDGQVYKGEARHHAKDPYNLYLMTGSGLIKIPKLQVQTMSALRLPKELNSALTIEALILDSYREHNGAIYVKADSSGKKKIFVKEKKENDQDFDLSIHGLWSALKYSLDLKEKSKLGGRNPLRQFYALSSRLTLDYPGIPEKISTEFSQYRTMRELAQRTDLGTFDKAFFGSLINLTDKASKSPLGRSLGLKRVVPNKKKKKPTDDEIQAKFLNMSQEEIKAELKRRSFSEKAISKIAAKNHGKLDPQFMVFIYILYKSGVYMHGVRGAKGADKYLEKAFQLFKTLNKRHGKYTLWWTKNLTQRLKRKDRSGANLNRIAKGIHARRLQALIEAGLGKQELSIQEWNKIIRVVNIAYSRTIAQLSFLNSYLRVNWAKVNEAPLIKLIEHGPGIYRQFIKSSVFKELGTDAEAKVILLALFRETIHHGLTQMNLYSGSFNFFKNPAIKEIIAVMKFLKANERTGYAFFDKRLNTADAILIGKYIKQKGKKVTPSSIKEAHDAIFNGLQKRYGDVKMLRGKWLVVTQTEYLKRRDPVTGKKLETNVPQFIQPAFSSRLEDISEKKPIVYRLSTNATEYYKQREELTDGKYDGYVDNILFRGHSSPTYFGNIYNLDMEVAHLGETIISALKKRPKGLDPLKVFMSGCYNHQLSKNVMNYVSKELDDQKYDVIFITASEHGQLSTGRTVLSKKIGFKTPDKDHPNYNYAGSSLDPYLFPLQDTQEAREFTLGKLFKNIRKNSAGYAKQTVLLLSTGNQEKERRTGQLQNGVQIAARPKAKTSPLSELRESNLHNLELPV